MEAEQLAFDLTNIEGEEGGISMDASPVSGNNMAFKVDCASFHPPHVQMDETGAATPMTEVTPPSGDGTAGHYQSTVTFTGEGEHDIICFNGTTRVRERVFAGDIPAWDPDKYQKSAAGIIVNERAKAAKIASTTGRLG